MKTRRLFPLGLPLLALTTLGCAEEAKPVAKPDAANTAPAGPGAPEGGPDAPKATPKK